jgi:tRNA modification GTPase
VRSEISNSKSQITDRAILLTPPGAAAIAVVRIVGPSVRKFLAAHFSRPLQPLRCVHGELRDAHGRMIDDPVVVLHEGENAADINLHGGPWVVQACLELARANEFDVIDRSTLPLPIETVDGADEIERQMLASLPLATTALALRALLAQPAAWRQFLAANPSLESSRQVADDHALWWLLHPPRVAIVGAPNVGKSTLANQLFAQQLSITADVPGTTRDWVGEIANLDGLAVMLLDTPGVRQTDDPIERTAIARSREQVGRADLIIVVLDATRPLAEQSDLLVAHPDALRIANKVDRPPAWDVSTHSDFQTIATTAGGIDALRSAIRERFGCESIAPQRPRWWTQRQREILLAVIEHCDVKLLECLF